MSGNKEKDIYISKLSQLRKMKNKRWRKDIEREISVVSLDTIRALVVVLSISFSGLNGSLLLVMK